MLRQIRPRLRRPDIVVNSNMKSINLTSMFNSDFTNKSLANFVNLVSRGSTSEPPHINYLIELNFMENSSPPKLKSKGIQAVGM